MKRRPKPVNFGKRRTLRFGESEEAAVGYMRQALAKNRGVDVEKIPFSEAHRLLVTENLEAARILSGQPEALTSSETVDLPAAFWDQLTECRNRLSHSQGSLYVILRKLNIDETVSAEDVHDAFMAVQESKVALCRIEQHAVEFFTSDSAGAGAEAGTEAG